MYHSAEGFVVLPHRMGSSGHSVVNENNKFGDEACRDCSRVQVQLFLEMKKYSLVILARAARSSSRNFKFSSYIMLNSTPPPRARQEGKGPRALLHPFSRCIIFFRYFVAVVVQCHFLARSHLSARRANEIFSHSPLVAFSRPHKKRAKTFVNTEKLTLHPAAAKRKTKTSPQSYSISHRRRGAARASG